MIPSDEARQTRRGVQKYFEFQGEPIEISSSSDHEDGEEDDDEEDAQDFMEEEEEGLEMVDEDFQNHN